ncbi:polycystic kidney disease protein 1-like 2 [Scyliorhinus canicula]|uniref:polycystic kidney disease protein 1-like 2 n=1 Tax=Scyliorhinus canicula TaxID=7830 RepID=UPI0018F58F57|nr:polycystic kidney disease protein 1-like 2 [Scyliorhinus canicula]
MEFRMLFIVAIYASYRTEAAPCLDNQSEFQSSCYEFVSVKLNFASAQGWCKGRGGHLAFIKNAETNGFLQSYVKDLEKRWIGLAYSAHGLIPKSTDNALTWLDGSASSYQSWLYGIPSSSSADCTYAYMDNTYLMWAMTNCNSMFSFICEFDSQVPSVYSIFHIIIPLEWQLSPNTGTFSCTVSTGDGKIYSVDRQEQSFTVAHLYNTSGVYSTSTECKTSKGYWTFHKTKIIFEPVDKPNGLQCYSPSVLDTTLNCEVRYGDTLWIQAGNGFNLTYTVSIGNTILKENTHLPGVIPIDQSSQTLIGPGQHNVTVHAANSTIETTQNITIHLLLEISGLEAVIESPALQLGNNVSIIVSISQGLPISLQFDFTDAYNILTYTVESANEKLPVYKFPMLKEGTFLVTVTASNTLSVVQLVVGHITVTYDLGASAIAQDSQNTTTSAKRKRALPDNVNICTARCPRPGTDATEVLLGELPDSEELFRNKSKDYLEQTIEDILLKFTMIAMNSSSLKGVQKANTYLAFITSRTDALSVTLQERASNILLILSDKLESFPVQRSSDIIWKLFAAKSGLYAASNLLSASTSNKNLDVDKEKCHLLVGGLVYHCVHDYLCISSQMENISEVLLTSIDKISFSLESQIHVEDPTYFFQTATFNMVLKRYNSSNIKASRVKTLEANPFSCTFPNFEDFQNISNQDFQFRMINFKENPFIWIEQSDINESMANISLSSNGIDLNIKNLSANFEILLPRSNTSQLFPATYTTFMNPAIYMFHVTDTESAIVISIESKPITSVQLYFSYGSKPNETLHEFEASFIPPSNTKVIVYTWVITSEMLMGRNGIYYLVAKPLLQSNISQTNSTNITISTMSTKCLYWDEGQHHWSTYGCKVGPKSNLYSTQCLCNHFSLFSTSILVLPNTVDVKDTVKLFSQIKDNSVVVSLLAAIFGVYIILVIWARMKDRQDLMKVKKTVLADNDPFAKYHYLVKVFTGHRRGAGTTSKVVMTLNGSAGQSDSHHLTDPKKRLFQQGSVDEFVLATAYPLGNLNSIRVWHNNSGSSPSWYINHVIIQDLETVEQQYFFCNCWLAVDIGEFVLDKTFPLASEAEMKDFRNLFFMKTAESFTDQHIWFSVFARPPKSSFTRVQRVSCCFSLLLCTMLTNIMFWGTASNETEEKVEPGKYNRIVIWRELIIGLESALIIFPVNLVIVQVFRNAIPKPTDMATMLNKSATSCGSSICQRTPESLMMDIKRIARSLPAKVKDIIPTLEEDIKNADDMNKLLALVANIVQHCKLIEQAKSQEVAIPDNENDSPAACNPDEQNEDRDSMASNPDQPEENDSTSSSPDEERDQTVTHFFHYVNLLLKYVEAELQEMGLKTFQNPYTQIHATDQVQKIIQLIKDGVRSEEDDCSVKREDAYRKEKKNVYSKSLPSWLIYIAWLLVFITSGVSAFFTMLYSFDYGKEKSIQWLISMIVSFIESVFVIQPIKVLVVAVFVALIVKKVERNENEESYNEDLLSTMHEDLGMTTPNFTNRMDAGIYNPPSLNNVEEMKALRLKEKKMYGFLKELFAHVGFLVMLAIIAYGERNPHSFYFSKALNNSFTKKFNGSLTIDDIYIWTDEILLPNLYGVYEGFITDGNSKLLGSPRIRQLRVKPAPCPVPTRLVDSIKECRVPYSYGDEDMSVFGTKRNFSGNTEFPWLTSIWHYQSESQLNGYPIWGKLAVYRGGGFVAEIGTERKAAARMIKYLRDNSWVDMYTRAIFVEFTVYNANVNLFCVVTLMLEMKAIGVFLGNVEIEIIRLFDYVDQNYSSIIGAQIIFILIVIYYMVMQGKLLKQKRMKYFWDKWNLIDLAIILCSWSAFGLYIKRAVLGTRVINDYLQNRDRFINFYESAIIDSGLGYTIAFLVSLATVKLWKLLHVNPKMRLITSSLQRAWSNLLGLLVILLVLLIAYSSLCYLVLGLNLSSYRTFSSSVITIIRLQLGTFNYDEVMRTTPFMGALIIGTCVIFIGFVLLNVLVSALLVSFSEERRNPLPREDEEIVDLLLMKLCNFLGIQRNMKKEKPSPEAGEMELLLEKEKL